MQDQIWRNKNFMSNPSVSASVNFNDRRKSKDWHCRTHSTDLLNLDKKKFDYKKNYLWKKFSEILKSEICTKSRNYGAHVLRVDEASVQNLRESHVRQYWSSFFSCRKCKSRWILWVIQETFKMWNRMIVESCLTFPVNLQWFGVLVPRSAATKDCHLTHVINLDYRKTFFGYQFTTFDSSHNHYQGIHHHTTPRETGSVPQAFGTGTSFKRDEERDEGTIPMPTCTVLFTFTSFSGFVLFKCLQPSFVVSHPFSWHVRGQNKCASFSGTSLLFEIGIS